MAGGRQKGSDNSDVVIIGGGIIGLSTAFYLSKIRNNGRSITIVDNAFILYAGASGKANGILGDYGFKPGAESLGNLSWELHRQLASQHKGRAAWGYRDVMIYKLHRTASLDASGIAQGSKHPPSALPAWCMHSETDTGVLISTQEHAARVNPADFCNFLQESCEKLGVRILRNTTVRGVGVNHGSLESISVADKDNRIRTLKCQGLVIAAGPWSETVLSRLFPNSRVRIPSSKRPSSGNYLVVKVPGWDGGQEQSVCHQVYLQDYLGRKVDISSRPNGTIYIGGSLSVQEELPQTSTMVQPQSNCVREMAMFAKSVLGDMEVLEEGRAYRPCLEHEGPIIARIPLDELLGVTDGEGVEGREVERGGVYLNVGHGRDGITLGPGSGKVMSELIERGRSESADISGLGIL